VGKAPEPTYWLVFEPVIPVIWTVVLFAELQALSGRKTRECQNLVLMGLYLVEFLQ